MGKTRLALHLAGLLRGDFPDGVAFVAARRGARPRTGARRDRAGAGAAHGVLQRPRGDGPAGRPPPRPARAADPRQRRAARRRRGGDRAAAARGRRGRASWPPRAARCGSARSSGTRWSRSARDAAVEEFAERARAVRPDLRARTAGAGRPSPGSWTAWGGCRWPSSSPRAGRHAEPRARSPTASAPSSRLLRSGPRDLPPRQQTLRSTLLWSYDLLDEPARRIFAAFAVFPGGATPGRRWRRSCPEHGRRRSRSTPSTALVDQGLVRRGADGSGAVHDPAGGARAGRRAAGGRRATVRRCGGGRPSGWPRWPAGPGPLLVTRGPGGVARPAAGRARQPAGGAGLGHRARPGAGRRHRRADVALLADARATSGRAARCWRRSSRRLGPDDVRARYAVLAALGGVAYWQRDLPAGEAACAEAVRLAEQIDDPARAGRGAVQPLLPGLAAGPAGRGGASSPTAASSCSPSSATATGRPARSGCTASWP